MQAQLALLLAAVGGT